MPKFIVVTPYREFHRNGSTPPFAINVDHILMIEPSLSGRENKGTRITMSFAGSRTIQHVVEENFLTLMEWLQ